jgi:hypothetical protein
MDAEKKASVLHSMMRRVGSGAADIKPEEWLEFVEAQNDGFRTGPEVGEKVPDFRLTDQKNRTWGLNDLMGPEGLLLVFSRSADW